MEGTVKLVSFMVTIISKLVIGSRGSVSLNFHSLIDCVVIRISGLPVTCKHSSDFIVFALVSSLDGGFSSPPSIGVSGFC